jgi:hypothetical protein
MNDLLLLAKEGGAFGIYGVFVYFFVKEILNRRTSKKESTICLLGSQNAYKVTKPLETIQACLIKMKMDMAEEKICMAERKDHQEKHFEESEEDAELVKKMYDLHNVKDADGVPIWYVRHSLEEAVKNLAISMDKLTESLRKE